MLNKLKKPIEGYRRTSLALVALTTIGVLVGVIVLIAQTSPGRTTYRGEFAQAASVVKGDQVTVAGIQVGAVTGLRLAGDRVIIDFDVDDNVHVGPVSRLAVKLTTLLGTRYLELSPAGTGPLPNRTIPLANTAVPYDLQQTLADATTTFEQVDADKIAESLGTLSKALTGLPQALPQTLSNLQSLSTVIADRRDQIGTLLASTDKLTAMIRNQKATLGSLILQARDLLGQLTRRRAAVEQLFAGATGLVDKSKAILDDAPNITAVLNSLSAVMDKIHKNDALLRNAFQIMPVTLRNLANATGTGMGLDLGLPMGSLADSWLCALSTRAPQFQLPEYFKDCQPVTDPYPGWPPPDPQGTGFPGYPPDSMLTTDAPMTAIESDGAATPMPSDPNANSTNPPPAAANPGGNP